MATDADGGCGSEGSNRGMALLPPGLTAALLVKLPRPTAERAEGVGSRRPEEAEAEALACCMAEAVRSCGQSLDRHATRERRVSVQSGGAGRVDAGKVL